MKIAKATCSVESKLSDLDVALLRTGAFRNVVVVGGDVVTEVQVVERLRDALRGGEFPVHVRALSDGGINPVVDLILLVAEGRS